MLLYRWKIVESLINKKEGLECNFVSYQNNPVHFDYQHFVKDASYNDHYNQYIFQKIIVFLDKKKLINISHNESYGFKTKKEKYKIRSNIFDFIFLKFLKSKNYFCDLSIGVKNFIQLNFFLRDFPIKDKINFSANKNIFFFNKMSKIDFKKREKIKININPNSEFEFFFLYFLKNHLPVSFLEDFKEIKNYVEKEIDLNPKTIISDINYYANLLFKIWVANSYNKGVKIILTDHGGSYGLLNGEFINEEISDKSFRYFKSKFKNSLHVPVIHNLQKRKIKFRSKLLVVTHGVSKYPFNVTTSPVSGQVLDQIDVVKNFYKNLPNKISDNFYVKPYHLKSWNMNNRFKDFFYDKVITNKDDYKRIYDNSKIIISTYPKTTFYESFLSGPSILLTNFDYFKINKNFDELHDALQKNQMLFENSLDASNFVSKVWDDVDDWWFSSGTQKALDVFKSFVAYEKKNNVKIWADLIKKTSK